MTRYDHRNTSHDFETVPAGADAYVLKHVVESFDDTRALRISYLFPLVTETHTGILKNPPSIGSSPTGARYIGLPPVCWQ
jgi:hypothetical protein